MATVRARRLLNNIIDGTINSTALQTALGTSSTRADFQQIVNERSKARIICATDNGASTVGQSAIALIDFFDSRFATNEYILNHTKLSQNIGATVAANNSLMSTFTASNSNLANAASTRILGEKIYTSSFAPTYSARFISSSTAWNLPAMENIIPVSSGGNRRSIAVNEQTFVYCHRSVSYSSGTAVYVSTNAGNSWTGYQVSALTGTTNSVAYGAGLFVIVGTEGRIFTSTNGVTWTSRTSGTSSTLSYIVFENGRFVVVGNTVNLYSTDGITWAAATGSTISGDPYGLEYVGSSVWIAIQNSTSCIRSTNNGISWTTLSLASAPLSITSNKNGTVILGITGGNTLVSTNTGSSFSQIAPSGGLSTSWPIYGVAYYAGNYIFGNQAISNIAYASGLTTFSSGYATALTPGGVAGINAVPSIGAIGNPNSYFVTGNRLFVDLSTSVFLMVYKGQ